ncbi:HPr kinase/phosphatase C-terminal domain-containing protein [Kiloniella laminariae]|uniref:HPr kinase/phosphatase C-terminal domain-containing protein n=1 Tax=Kiloniella laminariae TaxID=454162 RepID=A0ABT4LN42_9PROT|nr:HPr kinase/phosphatase C-terminal domain-containing protein [Kiloniella laminariae]MCZ4281367.1 HPr kinase/phosphatase C-terminal domain-containing protein [Kiloniella laminariae]
MAPQQLIHATCLAFEAVGDVAGQKIGVLLCGPSGSGKSDLALRALHEGCAMLVSDDQTSLLVRDEQLLASPPLTIAGRLEVRGLGLVSFPFCKEIPVKLVVDLVPQGGVERLPEPAWIDILGISLPKMSLYSFEASALAKLVLAMTRPDSDIDR